MEIQNHPIVKCYILYTIKIKCLFYNGEGGKRTVIKTDIEDGKMKFEQ
jgi:hypothetical protein